MPQNIIISLQQYKISSSYLFNKAYVILSYPTCHATCSRDFSHNGVWRQVARNFAQCNIPCKGQNHCTQVLKKFKCSLQSMLNCTKLREICLSTALRETLRSVITQQSKWRSALNSRGKIEINK